MSEFSYNIDLTAVYRIVHPVDIDYKFFSETHGAFSKTTY